MANLSYRLKTDKKFANEVRKSIFSQLKDSDVEVCNKCGAKFRLKATLRLHKCNNV